MTLLETIEVAAAVYWSQRLLTYAALWCLQSLLGWKARRAWEAAEKSHRAAQYPNRNYRESEGSSKTDAFRGFEGGDE